MPALDSGEPPRPAVLEPTPTVLVMGRAPYPSSSVLPQRPPLAVRDQELHAGAGHQQPARATRGIPPAGGQAGATELRAGPPPWGRGNRAPLATAGRSPRGLAPQRVSPYQHSDPSLSPGQAGSGRAALCGAGDGGGPRCGECWAVSPEQGLPFSPVTPLTPLPVSPVPELPHPTACSHPDPGNRQPGGCGE